MRLDTLEVEVEEPALIKSKKLPFQGSRFDDIVAGPTESELNSLALRKELNQRTGCVVFVHDQAQRQDFRKVLKYWQRIGELHFLPDVMVNPNVQPGKLQVGYETS